MGLFKKFFGYDYSDITADNMRNISDVYKMNGSPVYIKEGEKYLNFILREIENQAKSGNNILTLWNWQISDDINEELHYRGFNVENIIARYNYSDDEDLNYIRTCKGIKITW